MTPAPIAPLLPSPTPGQSGTQAPSTIPASEIGPGTETQIGLVIYQDSALMTDEDYLLSLPPQVAALRNVDPQTAGPTAARMALAQALLAAGFLIDNEIMVEGEDAFLTMVGRAGQGLTFTPPFGASWQVSPYDGFAGTIGPSGPFPPGAMKVSFLAADYPPFAPAAAPAPPANTVNPVGAPELFTVQGKRAWGFAPLPGVSLAIAFPVGTAGVAPDGTKVSVAALPGLFASTLVWVAAS